MATRCYLDIAIGDRAQYASDLEAHERARGYFSAVSSQVRRRLSRRRRVNAGITAAAYNERRIGQWLSVGAPAAGCTLADRPLPHVGALCD